VAFGGTEGRARETAVKNSDCALYERPFHCIMSGVLEHGRKDFGSRDLKAAFLTSAGAWLILLQFVETLYPSFNHAEVQKYWVTNFGRQLLKSCTSIANFEIRLTVCSKPFRYPI
jgi:hypothetical protein